MVILIIGFNQKAKKMTNHCMKEGHNQAITHFFVLNQSSCSKTLVHHDSFAEISR